MGLLDKVFSSTIDKRVNEQLASKLAGSYAKQLDSLVAFMNKGLPTINPDHADYEDAFKTIGAVYEVTDLICKKITPKLYSFKKIKDKKKYQQAKALEQHDPVQSYLLKLQAVEEVDNPKLLDLLMNPNPYQTGSQWLWTTALTYLLKGNTYWYGNQAGKSISELFCFPNMTINGDTENLLDPIVGYILENTNKTAFDKDEIYHLKTANPAPIDRNFEYLYGVSPLRAYLESLRTIKEGKTQSSKQAKNGGVFGVLSPRDKEDQLDSDQKKQLHDKMSAARRSDDEMARVFASSISLAWQSMGLPIADLQLIELVGANQEDVYRAYHVPLQYHNQKASTSNNQGTAVKQLIYDAVAPICEVIGEALTRFVGKGFGDIIIELDYTQLPEMAVNMKEVAEYLKPLIESGVVSLDEARVALKYGETGLAHMKEYYTAAGRVTVKSIYEGISSVTS